MGIKRQMSSFFKNKAKEEQIDLENRAKQFMQEYATIRRRYQCDFQSFLKLKDNGEGGISPSMRIVDITKDIEAEDKAKEEAEKKMEEQKINEEKKSG